MSFMELNGKRVTVNFFFPVLLLLLVAGSSRKCNAFYLKLNGIGFERCTFSGLEGSATEATYKDTDIRDNILRKNQLSDRTWITGHVNNSSLQIAGEMCSVVIVMHPPMFNVLQHLYFYRLNLGNLFLQLVKLEELNTFFRRARGILYFPLTLTILVYDGDALSNFKFVTTPAYPGEVKKRDFDQDKDILLQSSSRPREVFTQFKKGRVMIVGMDILHNFTPKNYWMCRHAYSLNTNPQRVKCAESIMISEMIKRKLNATSVYTTFKNGANPAAYLFCPNEQGCGGVITSNIIKTTVSRRDKGLLFSMDTEEYKKYPLYCMRTNTRESFRLEFWISPFDYYVWATIFISFVLVLPLLRHIFQELCLHSFKLNSKVQVVMTMNLLITFSSMMMRWSYECEISSRLTVLPPVLQIKSFEELINRNYKIIAGEGDHYSYFPRFESAGLTSKYNDSFVFVVGEYITDIRIMEYLPMCNNTFWSRVEFGLKVNEFIHKKFTNTYCHFLHEVFNTSFDHYSTSGPGKFRISEILNSLFEAGIVGRFKQIAKYAIVQPLLWEQVEEENEAVPFKITDWKVTSVFYGISLLFLVSVICFVVETCYKFRDIYDTTRH